MIQKDTEIVRLDLNSPAAAPREPKTDGGPGIFALEYWRNLFDVTDEELKERLLAVLNPKTAQIGASIAAKPELYLPFWISALLVVCVFVFANLSWTGGIQSFAFDLLWLATSYVFGYVLCFAAILHFYARMQGAKSEIFALVALLGYSLIFYIPAAALCCLPHPLFQFACLAAAFALSALFLWKNLRAVAVFESETAARFTALIALGAQLLFTLFFKLRLYGSG